MGTTILRCAATLGAIFGTAVVVFLALTFLFREDGTDVNQVTPEQRIETLFSETAIPPGTPPKLDKDPAELEEEGPPPAQAPM